MLRAEAWRIHTEAAICGSVLISHDEAMIAHVGTWLSREEANITMVRGICAKGNIAHSLLHL